MATSISRSANDEIAFVLRQTGPLGERDYELLYRHYKPRLSRYARAQGADDPEGAVDLALFDGFKAIERLENRTEFAFRDYLYKATLSHCRAGHRVPFPEPVEIDPDALSVDDATQALADAAWLRELVAALPPGQRRVVEERFFRERTSTEVGESLGKEANAVQQTQWRAMQRLRRAAFAALVVAVAVVALVGIVRTIRPVQVESGPIEQPDLTGSTVPSRPGTTPVDEDGASGPEVDDSSQRVDARPDSVPGSTASTPSTAQGTTLTSVASTTTEEPPTPTTGLTTSSSTAITTTTATTQPTTPSSLALATPLNACAPHQISPTMSAFKLYRASDAVQAAEFTPPQAIRFLNSTGTELHRIRTDGPMTTGRSAGAHGWVGAGDGTGTYANYPDAPVPAYWSVLAAESSTSGWVQLQAQDPATGAWSIVGGCP